MIVALVKHENKNRPFLFEIERTTEDVNVGDTVLCDTRYGEAKGVVLAMLQLTCGSEEILASACRATLPLKKVLRKYVKPVVSSIDEVPADIVEQIRQRELCKIINKLQSERPIVPFDI